MNRLKSILTLLILALFVSMKADYHILFVNDFKTHDIEAKIGYLEPIKLGRMKYVEKKIKPGAIGYFEFKNETPLEISFKKLGVRFGEPEYEVKEFSYHIKDRVVVIRPYSSFGTNYYEFKRIKNRQLNDVLLQDLYKVASIKRQIDEGWSLKKESIRAYIKLLEEFNEKYAKYLKGEIKFSGMKLRLQEKLKKIEEGEKGEKGVEAEDFGEWEILE